MTPTEDPKNKAVDTISFGFGVTIRKPTKDDNPLPNPPPAAIYIGSWNRNTKNWQNANAKLSLT